MFNLQDIARNILIKLRLIAQPDFSVTRVKIHPSPQQVKQGKMFIVGDNNLKKWVCMSCPDHCGEIILLSLNQSNHPSWSVEIDQLGRPTLSPSVRKLDGCRSHFWVRHGKIEWCADSGRKAEF